jgi:hypothetical protein
MIPNASNSDHVPQPVSDDVRPRFFLDDDFDASTDADWWLDLGRVDLPGVPAA